MLPTHDPTVLLAWRKVRRQSGMPQSISCIKPMATTAIPAAWSIWGLSPALSNSPITLSGTPKRTSGAASLCATKGLCRPSQNPRASAGSSSISNRSTLSDREGLHSTGDKPTLLCAKVSIVH